MKAIQILSVALVTWLASAQGWAQEFPPKKQITLVVGFAPGGAADNSARLIAKKLAENISQTIVVENKAGAGGNIAHHQVATGPTDGSVILLGSIGPLAVAPHLLKLNYDPLKDLAPLSGGVYFPSILVVNAESGIKSLADFTARAKSKPNEVSYATTGNGSASHLTAELFASYISADMLHVPYRGGSQAMPDLLAGRFTGYFSAPPTALPLVQSGKLTALATTGLVRPSYLAQVPTVAEQGYPGFQALNWYSFMAAANTPVALLDRWNLEIVKVLNDPSMKEALAKIGVTPQPTTRAEFAEFLRKEYVQWGKVVKERKIVAD